ncbi:hypothetical protein GmHk_01G001378 [Glycine max]|nr:hypothetical protein GmHk_01G001378 [Glycine max]
MNAKRREDMIVPLSKRRILMLHRICRGIKKRRCTSPRRPHNISSMTQDMTQTLRANEHLCRVMGNESCSPDWWVQFYMSPYVYTLIDASRT